MKKEIVCLLLVDDDSIATYINSVLLKKLKVCNQIRTASNGAEALEKLWEMNEDWRSCRQVIFLDINMPVMDGFEFVEEFNALELPHKELITIIVLSSSENAADKKRMESLGIKLFLTKPLVQPMLEKVLEEIDQ